MQHKLKVLAVVNAGVLSSSLSEVFCRDSIALHHAQSGAAALILTGNSLYDLLVIEAPVADVPVESLMSSMQSLEWASVGTPALVITDDTQVESTTHRLDSFAVRILNKNAAKEQIQQAVSELLGVPIRSSSRLMINVEVRSADQTALRCFQSENISESGLLLKGAQAIPVGARVDLSFTLPDETEPLQAGALVVRHTGSQETAGVGLRFVDLKPAEILRLRRFVDRNLVLTPPPAADRPADGESRLGA